jgi:peptidoglycan hydrolase CwlO-like protein
MSTRVQAAEVEATYPEPEDAHQIKIAELKATTATARDGVDHLTAQLQELEVQRTAVKEQLQQLLEKEKELEKLIDTVEPRIRYV